MTADAGSPRVCPDQGERGAGGRAPPGGGAAAGRAAAGPEWPADRRPPATSLSPGGGRGQAGQGGGRRYDDFGASTMWLRLRSTPCPAPLRLGPVSRSQPSGVPWHGISGPSLSVTPMVHAAESLLTPEAESRFRLMTSTRNNVASSDRTSQLHCTIIILLIGSDVLFLLCNSYTRPLLIFQRI